MGSDSSSFKGSDKDDSDMVIESESVQSDKEELIELDKMNENTKIQVKVSQDELTGVFTI